MQHGRKGWGGLKQDRRSRRNPGVVSFGAARNSWDFPNAFFFPPGSSRG